VTIEFAAGQALQIGRPATGQSGGLVVEGSSTGVTMTSAASSPAAGDWDGLYFAKSTADSSTSVTGLTIEYAGDNGYGCVYMVGADITIEDSTVQDCSNSGIYADSLSAPLVSGSTIQDNEDYGVYAYDLGTTGGPTFANNTVTGNGVHPIRISASGWHQLDSSSAYTGNGDDYVLVGGGTISYAGTDVQLLDVDYEVVGDVTLSKGTAMSVQDGVTFYNGVGVRWTIAGALTATGGTGGITWTSAQATAAIGDWEGIVANNASGTGISLDNVTIEYGGDSLGANFYCSFSSPTLINSTIAYSSGYGIYQYYCGGTFTGNTYTSNQGGATN
jgi:parallel beta-helix repeat protein